MTRSKCHVCGVVFNLHNHEMKYFGKRDIKKAQYVSPVTYPDWQAHIMLTCPAHRIRFMPESCMEDLDKYISLEQKNQLEDDYIEEMYLASDDVVE